MGKMYEVQFAKQLDGVSQYGNVTYSVKFTTESESVLWSVDPQKTAVAPGVQVFGSIETLMSKNGRPYKKFKREQQEQQATFHTPGTGTSILKEDRSDGMRQGMCINNASAWVNSYATNEITPEQWADLVFKYAQALYNKGDLNTATTQPTQDVVYTPTDDQMNGNFDMSTIDAAFGPVKAVPANR